MVDTPVELVEDFLTGRVAVITGTMLRLQQLLAQLGYLPLD
jgi:hypothetical protein